MTAAARHGVVIGWPIEHSKSPAMQSAALAAAGINGTFFPLGVPPASLAAIVDTLAASGVFGVSVTVPHKEAIVPLCARLEAPADRIGAVNCLTFERKGASRIVVGHNTDAGGFVDGLAAAGVACAGMRAVLLGAGGAARAVAAGLLDAGAASVQVIARRPDAVTCTSATAWTTDALRAAFATANLLVDTTPIALDAAAEPAMVDALPLDVLPAGAVVSSLVYHRRPLLLTRAEARGHQIVDGRGMLAYQGARAFALWFKRPAPIDVMLAALA
jgi:shikimate dehydrogenase